MFGVSLVAETFEHSGYKWAAIEGGRAHTDEWHWWFLGGGRMDGFLGHFAAANCFL